MMTRDLRESLERIESLAGKDLFFLLGVPRSGTTWLQRALNIHDEIRCLGESHFADILFANLQQSFQKFNRSVRQQGGAVAHLREFGGHVRSLTYDTQDLYLLLYFSMYLIFDKWVDSPTIRIIGEKTPDNIRGLNLLSTILPEARFVHIVRDGRDCAVSGWFFNQSGLDPNKIVVQSFDSYVVRFIRQWKAEIDLAQTAAKRLEDRYHELSFEKLVESPATELEAVCRFLGASTEPRILERCMGEASFESGSGGRPPGTEDRSSFYRKGVIGDWKNHFSESLSEQVWKLAGDSLSRLGYSRT